MMAITITNLPVEIQDLILKRLDVQSLTSAMRCCTLWHQGGQNFLKSWCITHISKQILSEIINTNEQIDWLQITLEWAQFPTFSTSSSSKLKPSTIFPPTYNVKKTDHFPIALSGDYLFIAHTAKVFTVINDDSPATLELETFIEVPRNCFDLKLLNSSNGRFVLNDKYLQKFVLHDAIITVSNRSIYVQTLPIFGGQVVFKSRLQIPCLRTVSTRGNQFAFYSNRHVNVYEMRLDDVFLVCQFKSRPLRVLQLWMDEIICIDNFGCVTKYSISMQTVVYTCNRMTNVLRYPLTTVISRGVIFADLKMMKTMLSYWHVASGNPEWMLCNVSDDDRCCWERINSTVNVDEEITTFSMRKAVIAAGTSKGRVAFYRHLGCTDQITTTISQPPLFVVSVAPDEPITFCDFSTAHAILHLCVRTKLNSVLTLTIPTTELYN